MTPRQNADGMDSRLFSAVVLSGVLTGAELASRLIVHPTLWKLEHAEQVRTEKLIYKRFGSIEPFLMTATTSACFVAAKGVQGRALALAAGGCYATMVGITLIGNMPINLRVFQWDERHGNPDEWRLFRREWDRLHSARVIFDSAGLLLITLGALHA